MEATGYKFADSQPENGCLSPAMPSLASFLRLDCDPWRACWFALPCATLASVAFFRLWVPQDSSRIGHVVNAGLASMAAVMFWSFSVFDFGFGRLIPAAVGFKGGRWTKDQCGGVQGWRAGLSGPAWANRRRSG